MYFADKISIVQGQRLALKEPTAPYIDIQVE